MLFFSHGDLKRQGSQKNKLAVVLELKAQRSVETPKGAEIGMDIIPCAVGNATALEWGC